MNYDDKYSWYIALLVENSKIHDRKSVRHEMVQRDLLNYEKKMTGQEIIACTRLAFPSLVEV